MRELLERLREMHERYETPFSVRQVESHLIFGPVARYLPVGAVAALIGIGMVMLDIAQKHRAPATRVGSIVEHAVIWGSFAALSSLTMTRRQQAILAWGATKFTLGITAFIMVFVGAGSAFREGDVRDALVFLLLGLVWFPSLEFSPTIGPFQKYLTIARLLLSVPLVIMGIQGGNWHWET